MSYTRRHLIQGGAALATAGALGALPRPLRAAVRSQSCRQCSEFVLPFEDPQLKPLTDASLSAARAAGAAYADVRLTHTYTKRFPMGYYPAESEVMTVGVRVLVDGYWGFASSPVWTVDEAVRLARAAVRNAKANTLGKPRTLELAPIASIVNGHWTTPIKEDPFAISRDEIQDYLEGIRLFCNRFDDASGIVSFAEFVKQDKAYASTLDQYYTQRLYRSGGLIYLSVRYKNRKTQAILDTVTSAGAGFEYFREQPIREQLEALYQETREELSLPIKPVDVGRFNAIFDAWSVAGFLSQSIGSATELDRALGYEANAGGTSYITDPLEMMGTLKIGAPSISITGNRSEPGGVATVHWDDEGVVPNTFTLVKDGILTDMQTNREGASWLKEVYAKRQQPIVSHGCAYSPEAIQSPLTHCANLHLTPNSANETLDSLIAGESNGILFKRLETSMDFQNVTGFSKGRAFEIKDGKKVAELKGAGIVFRTPELWNSVLTLGGTSSQRRYGLAASKGQPPQTSYHSVTSVPMALKDITVIDVIRKA